MQAIFFILVLIFTIHKHLNKREAMHQKDVSLCNYFYTIGIWIYLYHLFIYNLGNFDRIKPTYSIFPFILIIILYIILVRIIKKGYKYTYVMKIDFEILKIIDKECCSICLNDFNYNKIKLIKYFVK